MQTKPLQDVLRVRSQLLEFVKRRFRRRHLDELDLGKLMHADEAPRVLAGRAGLGAPRRRVRHVLQRQAVSVEDLLAVEIGDRYLSSRYQPQVAVFDLEEHVGKLGE